MFFLLIRDLSDSNPRYFHCVISDNISNKKEEISKYNIINTKGCEEELYYDFYIVAKMEQRQKDTWLRTSCTFERHELISVTKCASIRNRIVSDSKSENNRKSRR